MPDSLKGLFTFLLLLALAAGAWWFARGRASSRPSPSPDAVPPTPVETALPERRDFTRSIPFHGVVESRRVVRVVAAVDARVVEQHVEDGAVVKPGTPLFTLGGPRAAAQLEALEAQATCLERQAASAGKIVEKRREASALGLLPQEDVAAAEGERSRLEGDGAAARSAEKAFRDSLLVSAPGGGTFTDRRVSPGQYVTRGTGLARILAAGELRVVARIFAPPGVSLSGKTAEIRATGGRVLDARVLRVIPERSPEGAVVAWIEGGGIDDILAPGEPVSGEITLAVRKGVLAVPESAVVRDELERAWVFPVETTGPVRRAVDAGLTVGGWVEVRSGLSETERVVVRDAYELYYRDFRRTYQVED